MTFFRLPFLLSVEPGKNREAKINVEKIRNVFFTSHFQRLLVRSEYRRQILTHFPYVSKVCVQQMSYRLTKPLLADVYFCSCFTYFLLVYHVYYVQRHVLNKKAKQYLQRTDWWRTDSSPIRFDITATFALHLPSWKKVLFLLLHENHGIIFRGIESRMKCELDEIHHLQCLRWMLCLIPVFERLPEECTGRSKKRRNFVCESTI